MRVQRFCFAWPACCYLSAERIESRCEVHFLCSTCCIREAERIHKFILVHVRIELCVLDERAERILLCFCEFDSAENVERIVI